MVKFVYEFGFSPKPIKVLHIKNLIGFWIGLKELKFFAFSFCKKLKLFPFVNEYLYNTKE